VNITMYRQYPPRSPAPLTNFFASRIIFKT
jgi:hypothetical protein